MPLIAETGGINAMIVDATALPEQVTDDVITSAFRSAGQRCSALRLLCVQDDVADRMLDMIAGAARELKLGDPRDPATHVGPVIDAEAKDKLERWIADMAARGACASAGMAARAAGAGTYVRARHHRARPRARADARKCSARCCTWCAGAPASSTRCSTTSPATATALTLGIHSRIDATVARIAARLAQRQCLRQPQHDRRRGRHASRSAAAACPAPGRRRAARIICAASRWSRWSRSTPRPPAATPRC